MNERIKELARESGLLVHNPNGVPTKLGKFAELLIKECTDVLNKRLIGDFNREDIEVRRCIADVNKHFGVES